MQTHQNFSDPTRTTVTLPTWLYMYYKRQALESQTTFTDMIERVLRSQVGEDIKPAAKQKKGFQSIIECAEKIHEQYAYDLKKVPPDLATNYKQYLYGGKKWYL